MQIQTPYLAAALALTSDPLIADDIVRATAVRTQLQPYLPLLRNVLSFSEWDMLDIVARHPAPISMSGLGSTVRVYYSRPGHPVEILLRQLETYSATYSPVGAAGAIRAVEGIVSARAPTPRTTRTAQSAGSQMASTFPAPALRSSADLLQSVYSG